MIETPPPPVAIRRSGARHEAPSPRPSTLSDFRDRNPSRRSRDRTAAFRRLPRGTRPDLAIGATVPHRAGSGPSSPWLTLGSDPRTLTGPASSRKFPPIGRVSGAHPGTPRPMHTRTPRGRRGRRCVPRSAGYRSPRWIRPGSSPPEPGSLVGECPRCGSDPTCLPAPPPCAPRHRVTPSPGETRRAPAPNRPLRRVRRRDLDGRAAVRRRDPHVRGSPVRPDRRRHARPRSRPARGSPAPRRVSVDASDASRNTGRDDRGSDARASSSSSSPPATRSASRSRSSITIGAPRREAPPRRSSRACSGRPGARTPRPPARVEGARRTGPRLGGSPRPGARSA